jgi:hypothetical protein
LTTIGAVRRILRADENLFDIFAVWLYFLRDLDTQGRPKPAIRTFALEFRTFWQEAWDTLASTPGVGTLYSPERRIAARRWLLTEDDGGPPWETLDLMRAFREG